MNHSYRLFWNHTAQRYVPVPETARGRGKSRIALALAPMALLLGAMLALPAGAQDLPTGERVVSGAATIERDGPHMTIHQQTSKAILNWQGFDIGRGASVQFKQSGVNAIALNRVAAGTASRIDGQLHANGQVWLVNPNGVVFGKGSEVNVGGLVASTLDITDQDFNNNRQVFTRGAAQGGIDNFGEITVDDGGMLALLAPNVRNEGHLSARLGDVVLAGGNMVTLQAGADGWLQVAVEPATVATLIENRQMIEADGGQVVMTARAANELSGSVVSNTGAVQAHTLENRQGRILLLGDMRYGTVVNSELLDARAPEQGHGGFIETSAAVVTLPAGREVTTKADHGHTGFWLINRKGYTIAPRGGDSSGAQLSADLASNNVFINTTIAGGDGDIHVNDAVHWSANQLTLNAQRNIDVGARMEVKGNGTLHFNYGDTAGNAGTAPLAGSNLNVDPGKGQVRFEKSGAGLLAINGHGYEVIKDARALQRIGSTGKLGGSYALGGSVSADGIPFKPIGSSPENAFTGSFDGLGHTISSLEIELPEHDGVGLFGHASNATLRNVKLDGVRVHGNFNVGALVGSQMADSGMASISNVRVRARVQGENFVGGLVGENAAINDGVASISNAHSSGRYWVTSWSADWLASTGPWTAAGPTSTMPPPPPR